LANFLHIGVIGVPSSLTARPALELPSPPSRQPSAWTLAWPQLGAAALLPTLAAVLVTLPVFVQAPWVRQAPVSALAFTGPLLALALGLARWGRGPWRAVGEVLVGFCGSWLGGCLFWGWCRLHPVEHLPLEACVLPLAIAGLRSPWRRAGAFYLGSLLGTAATDGAMALTGVMPLWPAVVTAPLEDAPQLLQQAALAVLQPVPLMLVTAAAVLVLALSRSLWNLGESGRIAAAALATTLAVDALFLGAASAAPNLSGLI